MKRSRRVILTMMGSAAVGAVSMGLVPRRDCGPGLTGVPGPDGRLMHAALQVNGSTVMLNDDFPEYNDGKSSTPTALGGTPVTIHLTVSDVDAKFQQAIDAGATVIAALEDQFWGDRYGVLRDPFGHHWSLGQPVREVSQEEIAEAMKQGS